MITVKLTAFQVIKLSLLNKLSRLRHDKKQKPGLAATLYVYVFHILESGRI